MASHLPNYFDAEASLFEFECMIDTLDKISDGLTEDRTTSNALIGVHTTLCKIYADFRTHLMED